MAAMNVPATRRQDVWEIELRLKERCEVSRKLEHLCAESLMVTLAASPRKVYLSGFLVREAGRRYRTANDSELVKGATFEEFSTYSA